MLLIRSYASYVIKVKKIGVIKPFNSEIKEILVGHAAALYTSSERVRNLGF